MGKRLRSGSVIGSLVLSATVASAQTRNAVATIHVADYANVPAHYLTEARKQVSRVFAAAGVELRWSEGSASQNAEDGFLRAVVVILDEPMTTRVGASSAEVGRAYPEVRRAYVHYPRLVARAIQTRSDIVLLLGMAIAHELGHLMLPGRGHSTTGIMRAASNTRVVALPGFDEQQAAELRAFVTRGECACD